MSRDGNLGNGRAVEPKDKPTEAIGRTVVPVLGSDHRRDVSVIEAPDAERMKDGVAFCEHPPRLGLGRDTTLL